jgi:hypothetical protein
MEIQMLTNPTSVTGIVITVLGWLWLFLGAGRDVGELDIRVINFHSLAIANNVILLGYFLVVVGTLSYGLDRIAIKLGGPKAIGKLPVAVRSGSSDLTTNEIGEIEAIERRMMELGYNPRQTAK